MLSWEHSGPRQRSVFLTISQLNHKAVTTLCRYFNVLTSLQRPYNVVQTPCGDWDNIAFWMVIQLKLTPPVFLPSCLFYIMNHLHSSKKKRSSNFSSFSCIKELRCVYAIRLRYLRSLFLVTFIYITLAFLSYVYLR